MKFIFRHGMIFISQCEMKIMPWPGLADSGEIKIMPWLGPAGLAKKNMPWPQSQAGIIHVAYDFSQPGGAAWRLEPASCEK